MENLLKDIRNCKVCVPHLLLGPRPIVSAHPKSEIVIVGQAPGIIVHKTGIPWNDKSGENLRSWMNIGNEDFYDVTKIAIVPMGFCYPGKGKTGDLPPRKECAPLWHEPLLTQLKEVKLILLVGKYAQDYYLKNRSYKTLTENVRRFDEFLPQFFVLPHPSPRNNIWMKKNDWFKALVVPVLQERIGKIMDQ